MSDLDNLLSGIEATEPEQPQEQPEPQTEQPETVETVEAEPKAETPEEPKEEAPQNIPYPVFKSTRDDLKAQIDQAKREAEYWRTQSQPKQEQPKAPDVLDDQDGYAKHITGTLEQRLTEQRLEQSRFFAEREFGKDQVAEVVEYFNQHPQESHQFVNAPSPFHAAMEFYSAQKTAREIGPDPAAYKAKLEQEIRQKIEAELAAKQAKDMASRAPASLAGVNGSGGTQDPGWQGPADLDNLIG